jgi:hypothetical protein
VHCRNAQLFLERSLRDRFARERGGDAAHDLQQPSASSVDDARVSQDVEQLGRSLDRVGPTKHDGRQQLARTTGDVRLRLLCHFADNREHRPFDRLCHSAVRGVAGPTERPRQRRRVKPLGLGDDLGEAAQDLREDDAGVPAGAHQRCARQFVRERREIVRGRRVELFDRRSDGQGEIRARVAVGDRVDVEVVDAPAVAFEREQRAARKLARPFDVGHAVN